MGSLMIHVAKKVNTVLEKLDAIEASDNLENRRNASAGARSVTSAGARSVKSAGARSLTSARGKPESLTLSDTLIGRSFIIPIVQAVLIKLYIQT
jgi:hypothetical protein